MKKFLKHLIYWVFFVCLVLLQCLVVVGDWVSEKGFDYLDKLNILGGDR